MDSQLYTLHHLHLTLRHSPSSSTNVTRICCHLCSLLYILLSLVGVATNDLVSIVVNIVAETPHGENREGSFQLVHQLFNYR